MTTSPGGAPGDAPRLSERELHVLRSFARRIDPDDAGAHNNLGVLYFSKALHEEAADAFTRALQLDPRMTVAQRNLEIAYFTTGLYDRRVGWLRRHVAARPDDRDARRALARLYRLLGQLSEAVEQLELLLASAPDDPEVLRELALAEQKSGNLESAAEHIARALAVRPQDAQLHFLAGEVAYHRGLNADAVASLRRAISLEAGLADAHYLLGFVLGDMGDHQAAREATRRAGQLNPALNRAQPNLALERFDAASYRSASHRRVELGATPQVNVAVLGTLVHFNLGLAFRQKGYLAEALAEYQRGLELGEDPVLVREAMAEVHLLRRESAEATRLYDQLLRDEPENAKLWNERGVALHQDGRYAEACESYERAVRARPLYAAAHNNLGVAYFHSGRIDAAVEAFRRALEANPGFTRARLNLALILLKRGEHQLCLDAYRAVLRDAPDQPVAWNGVGLVLAALKKFEDARNAFARAIDVRPDFAEAHYNLSFVLSNLGDFTGALRETKRALELDPYYVPQKFELAVELPHEEAQLGVAPDLGGERREETVAEFTFDAAALQSLFAGLDRDSAPAPASAPYAEARVRADVGDVEGALSAIATALGGGAPLGEGLLLQGELYARQGAHGEAVDRYRQARALDTDSTAALLGEVRALVALGRGREASEPAEELLSRSPNDVEVLLLVARVRADGERFTAAMELLETARRLEPMRADVPRQMGDVARAAGNAPSAIDAYRHALTLDGDLAGARLDLAPLLESAGDVAGAERELEAALATVPTYVEAALALADLRRRHGRPDETIDVLRDVLRRDPYHLDALASLGESLFQAGRRADAAVAFGRVLRFDAEHVAALYFDGVLLAEERSYDLALARWQRVIDLEPASEFARRARRDTRTAHDLIRIFRDRRRGAA